MMMMGLVSILIFFPHSGGCEPSTAGNCCASAGGFLPGEIGK